MTEFDLNQTTQSEMDTNVDNFQVDSKTLDSPNSQGETFWTNPEWNEYLGYYKKTPELKQAVDSLSMYVAGKGYTCENVRNEVLLENINGWGEDCFESIMQNMLVIKKINGDAFAEIIRNKSGTLINLKPLNPEKVRIVTNSKGVIIRYDYLGDNKKIKHKFEPNEIFHISNKRVGDEIHGISVIEAAKWVIDAKREAEEDWRRVSHRSTIRVMYVDSDSPSKLNEVKEQYAEAIEDGELLIMPGKQGEKGFEDLTAPPINNFIVWIQHLDSRLYQILGVPRAILGGTQEQTEASSKVAVFTFDQVWMSEQRLLEKDIWSQLALRITFNRPASLKEPLNSDEAANTGQVGFQPKDTQLNMARGE